MRVAPVLTLFALLEPGIARAGDAATGARAATPETSAAAEPAAVEPTPPLSPSPTIKNRAIKRFPKLEEPSLVHVYQLGLALLPGVGFRVVAPYRDTISCGQQGKPVCTGMLPFFLDVQPSFGFAQHWDVLMDLRFGIVSDFNRTHQFAVAPGVRYWVDPDQPVKFFASIQGVFDATAQNNDSLRRYDFGVRNANGIMFEVMRNFGFYLQLGETIGFARWLRFEIDGGVGVQARIP
jgi:hypothetical protein